jgi:hypothetical protein
MPLGKFAVLPLALDGLALLAGDVEYQNSLLQNPTSSSLNGNLTDDNDAALNVSKEAMNR